MPPETGPGCTGCAVRPSRREPLTGHRLVTALRQAGFRPHDAVYLPTDHAGADEIIASADLAMVYGGQRVVDKYAADPAVIVNGPGRSKIVITAEQDWRECLDVVVDSVARHGGMACVNATAVLYEGDPAPLAAAVAERLAATTSGRCCRPCRCRGRAPWTTLLGADQVVADLGGGQAALRPAVHVLTEPDPELLNLELPFPCVWVTGWSREGGRAAALCGAHWWSPRSPATTR